MSTEKRKIGPYKRKGTIVSSHMRSVPGTQPRDDSKHVSSVRKLSISGINNLASDTLWPIAAEITIKKSVDTETGESHISVREGEKEVSLASGGQPGTVVDDHLFFLGVNYDNMNLDGYHFFCVASEKLTFKNSSLDNTMFVHRRSTRSGYLQMGMMLHECDFSGASLRGANFEQALIRNSSFRGADVTGANFINVDILTIKVDFTGSNITGEQVDSMLSSKERIIYDRHSMEEVIEATGLNADEVAVMIWAGDIEVRDNKTKNVVKDGFDGAVHHIPQWEVQRLIGNKPQEPGS